MSETQPTQAPGAQGQGRGGRRRGRGGGFGAARQPGQPEGHQHSHDGSGRGARSRGQGPRRGGAGGRDKQSRTGNKSEASAETPADAPAGSESKGKQPVAEESDNADDSEVCFICASKVDHTSVSPCNHRTCHICALRLRALYKNKACAHCRTESNYVIFTDDHTKRFEDFTDADFSQKDENLGIKYENNDIFEDTVLLLRYNCPDRGCDVACLGWPDLHRHVKSKHSRVMCDLCTRNKKVFTHEHEVFTTAELRKHEKYGDDVPGAIDQSGFKGHPECGFCRQRFYGDDELYAHCRDRHERCHICDRLSASRQQQYYIDYNALEGHFQKDHFLCLDQECLEKKFVVFESQMDLKAHQLEAHPNGLSKDARRDARTVDLSTFDYRAPYQPQQRQQRRGAGRGRDPNAEPLPVSSAQPLRRDEVAYQRQMAIQSAQSVSTRSFGGQLTRDDTQPVRAPARPTSTQTSAATPPVAEMEGLNTTADSGSVTPQEQARRLRHAAVVERASNLLGNDQHKLKEFRTRVSSYRTSSISATELIDAFFSLFDTSSSELGKLVKELADIYEDEGKRTALLKSWNDWRAINEDYPALPGPGGILPGMSPSTVSSGGVGGKRVLRLKSSTAQSSRSAVGRSGAMPSSSSSTNPFPPLSSTTARSTPRSSTPATTPWGAAAAASAPTSAFSSAPSSRSVSRAPSRPVNTNNTDAFPALPAAPKPNVLMAGLTRGTVRWDDRRQPTANAWSSSSRNDSSTAEEDFPDDTMATLLPPPTKRQRTETAERARQQQEVQSVPENLGSIRVQFFDQATGSATGPAVSVPVADATVKNLETLLNTLQGNEEDERVPYRFTYQSDGKGKDTDKQTIDILSDLYHSLLKPGLKTTEDTVQLYFTPQAVFRVKAVSRCSASIAGHGEAILATSFSPVNSSTMVTGSGDSTARIWDCDTGTPLHTLKGHTSWVLAVAYSPNGAMVATGSMDNTVRVWDAKKGTPLGAPMKGHAKWITSLAWEPYHLQQPGRPRLASASKDSTVRIWDVVSKRIDIVLTGHKGSVTCVRWGGTGNIYTASHDKSIKVWNAQNGTLVQTLSAHVHRVNHLALSTDFVLRTAYHDHTGQVPQADSEKVAAAKKRFEQAATINNKIVEKLVSASDDFTMYLWEPGSSNKPISRMLGHQKEVNHVTFSPDMAYIASAGFDNHVKLWNARDGKFITTLRGHVGAVYQCCFSADSRLLVSSSKDTTLKVWNVRTGKLSEDLPGHKDEVFAVDWSPDGQKVGSGGKDKAVRIWRN
ncbi:hypothetical protein BO94DRAFT_562671 [Aspergillus sclerotioniger CBS 115572]|uniref:Ribosome assembly protein 4 n=1 Tax=Aspergillus sclerotioniger CBS 115572 TaxID=1450535 RepID=A0A317XEE4_9EURO|nr:hypothetical protein BO94DRAFT_562671 [Aspergillus sclerotioniger CBS 115572]PWY94950.1 hypothetical protein BO94DRAFT_562671 [Aspergillus sclerotioniger CBS 115572]